MLNGKHSRVYFIDLKNYENFFNNFFNCNNFFERKIPQKLIKKQFLTKDLKSNFYKEVISLSKLSKYSFIPKIIYHNPEKLFIIMEYIEGINLKNFIDYLQSFRNKLIVKKILIKTYKILIKICIILDLEGIFKDEWNRPFKHVILKMNNNQILGIYIIDFDRANFNKELRNLPQFLTFAFNNLGFKQYFYLIKEIIYFYRKIFKKYLSFREDFR
jgi:predicted Ser/Thr protein kinase